MFMEFGEKLMPQKMTDKNYRPGHKLQAGAGIKTLKPWKLVKVL